MRKLYYIKEIDTGLEWKSWLNSDFKDGVTRIKLLILLPILVIMMSAETFLIFWDMFTDGLGKWIESFRDAKIR